MRFMKGMIFRKTYKEKSETGQRSGQSKLSDHLTDLLKWVMHEVMMTVS